MRQLLVKVDGNVVVMTLEDLIADVMTPATRALVKTIATHALVKTSDESKDLNDYYAKEMMTGQDINISFAKACWLTINRACNLRCEWCYAKETEFQSDDNMSLEMIEDLVNMCYNNNVLYYILIGGEPTIHPAFFEIINLLAKKGCKTTIVTNGLKLANKSFCEKLSVYKDNLRISISLKGSSDDYYQAHCGAAVFTQVCQAITNCKDNNLAFSLSYVISADNVASIDVFAKEIKASGITDFIGFSFCNEVIQRSGGFDEVYKEQNSPIQVNAILNEKYEALNSILDGNFSIHQSLPLCLCDKNILSKMKSRNHISTSCHVHNREGIIFDTNGEILLCNHFVGYGIGKYGVDYYDADSLLKFWNSPNMIRFHQMLTSMPSKECVNCNLSENCGGGCCIQWFTHSFENYLSEYKKINP